MTRPSKRIPHALPAVALALATSGCAHYQMPISPMESPETLGEGRAPKIEVLGLRSGVELDTPASPASEPGDKATLASSVRPFTGARASLGPRLDLGARFSPHAPFTFLAKWQFTGGTNATPGIAGSLVGGAGLLRGSAGSESVTYLGGSISAPIGYRFEAVNHQLIGTPFATMASVSGVGRAATTTTSGAGSATAAETSISAMAYGASVGYAYRMQELLNLQVELGYALGSSGEDSLPTLQFGVLAAYEL